MKKRAKYTAKELAEAHVFPSELSVVERKKEENQFSAFRRNRLKQMTEEDRYLSRLLQLKYQMEDYVNTDVYNKDFTFSYFLNEYIHSLNKTKSDFSKEISLHLTQLSRLLNDKEKPNDKILIRLEIHSNNLIPAVSWYKILEKQKETELINDKRLRISERRKVRNRFNFSKA